MLQFSANLTFLFNEVGFIDRFMAASRAGFCGVEFLDARHIAPAQLRDAVELNNLQVVLFNTAIGDWEQGDRGIAALAGREAEAVDELSRALEIANLLNCKQLHVMSGLTTLGASLDVLRDNLQKMAPMAAEQDVSLLLEPINGIDMPEYLIQRTEQVTDLLSELELPNVRLQFDIYHRQMMDHDALEVLEKFVPDAAHLQIANTPGRHEPDKGVLDYSEVFRRLQLIGYQGWIGCEYKPSNNTMSSLRWLNTLV